MNYIASLYKGRIARRSYIWSLISAYLVYLVITVVFASIGSPTLYPVFILLALAIIFLLPLHVRRVHDLGDSGWILLLLLIPVFNLVFEIALFFVKGEGTSNAYGQPPQNSENFLNDFLKLKKRSPAMTAK